MNVTFFDCNSSTLFSLIDNLSSRSVRSRHDGARWALWLLAVEEDEGKAEEDKAVKSGDCIDRDRIDIF